MQKEAEALEILKTINTTAQHLTNAGYSRQQVAGSLIALGARLIADSEGVSNAAQIVHNFADDIVKTDSPIMH